jgi:uracil permease
MDAGDVFAGFKTLFQGVQILFVAFGALVLVPLLTGLDPGVALCTAGIGTLIFQAATGMKVPIFLASSFAFVPAITYGVAAWGVPGTLCGLAASGLLYVALSFVVRVFGSGVVTRLFPPVVVGPVICVIGLSLAPSAVGMALGRSGGLQVVPAETALFIAGVSLLATLLAFLFGRSWIGLVPILVGIAAGYAVSAALGVVDYAGIAGAAWFSVPAFVFPAWNPAAVLFIVPVAIAPALARFGDILALGAGIPRTMLGDGIATLAASFVGGPPNTTYSEVTGAVTLTRAYNPVIMTVAAVFAIVFAFVGKIGAGLQSIPPPVMGGVMVLLFGLIASLGIKHLVVHQVDLGVQKNAVILSLVLVTGIGGLCIPIGEFELAGVGLAAIIGVVLNLLIPEPAGPGVR